MDNADTLGDYLSAAASTDADVFIYGVRNTSRVEPMYAIDADVPGVDYFAMVESEDTVYRDQLDTFLEELPGEPEDDIQAYIEEKLGYFDISADTYIVNDTEPYALQHVEEAVVENRFNPSNPVHRVRYLATQLERADDRIRTLQQENQGEEQETVRQQRREAIRNVGLKPAAPLLVAAGITPDQPAVGAALALAGTGLFVYQSGLEGERLESTFEDIADTLDGADSANQ